MYEQLFLTVIPQRPVVDDRAASLSLPAHQNASLQLLHLRFRCSSFHSFARDESPAAVVSFLRLIPENDAL